MSKGEGGFIDGTQALQYANDQLAGMRVEQDPMFASWSDASLGRPILVRTVFGAESYWLVPVVVRDRTVGFVRVMGDGRVAAVGTSGQPSSDLDSFPMVVTGITAEEAYRLAQGRLHPDRGETAKEPVYVHDGPPGREAWLVEVMAWGRPSRWVFVTPGFTYERPAGQVLDEGLE